MDEFKIDSQLRSPLSDAFKPQKASNARQESFGQMLASKLDQVNGLQIESDRRVEDLATGRQTDIHQTMIAVEKASVSFEFLMQIRNKLIAAYDQIMRLQV